MAFSIETTEGSFSLPAEGWLLLFFYAGDFLPVSATELMGLAELQGDLLRQGCRILCLSSDSRAVHLAFLENLRRHRGTPICFPLGTAPVTEKSILLLHEGELMAQFTYPPQVGVNFTEVYRTLLALKTGRSTPCGWVPGANTLALPPATRGEMDHYMKEQEKEGRICVDWYICFEN
ncbi:MAG: redoxin domain-containing protein [Clostridia bacterium]|nr:redoxin domain-containing protein [Clostridia bacterium]